MSTCPPLAQDRLSGLAGVSRYLISNMEDKNNPRLPTKTSELELCNDLCKIVDVIQRMIDPDVFIWFDDYENTNADDIWRAATVIADWLCGADSNPIIRNDQERCQLVLVLERNPQAMPVVRQLVLPVP
jgi:DNA-binding XRE family transcriptional regulator